MQTITVLIKYSKNQYQVYLQRYGLEWLN